MDKKSWIKDIFSPSNLWTAFQSAFPTGAGAVSGVLSYLWKMPPSVILMVALMTAAAALVLATEIRKSSVLQMLDIASIHPIHYLYQPDTGHLLLKLEVRLRNNHPLNHIHLRVQLLNFALQGRASTLALISDTLLVPPLGTQSFTLPTVFGLELGDCSGQLHFRVEYGKSNSLGHEIEWRPDLGINAHLLSSGDVQMQFVYYYKDAKTGDRIA